MISVNEYFDGKVKSLGFATPECPVTMGVMVPGDYEFGTSSVEYITVVHGTMTVLLPGATEWKTYKPYDTFIVPKDSKFQLKIAETCGYVCLYK